RRPVVLAAGRQGAVGVDEPLEVVLLGVGQQACRGRDDLRVLVAARGEGAEGRLVVVVRRAGLFGVVAAVHPCRRAAALLAGARLGGVRDGGQEEGDEDGDDGNHYQQLDQGETGSGSRSHETVPPAAGQRAGALPAALFGSIGVKESARGNGRRPPRRGAAS